MRAEEEVIEVEEHVPADGWADVALASKDAESAWLSSLVAQFEANGGQIQQVATGVSCGVGVLGDESTQWMIAGAQAANERRRREAEADDPRRRDNVLRAIENGATGMVEIATKAKMSTATLLRLAEKYNIKIPLRR